MSYASEVLADSPLVYARLGEASGTTAVDASGNAHDGTYISSPTLGVAGLVPSDPSNTCVSFDGTSSRRAEWTAAGWNQITSAFTVEIVLQPGAVSGSRCIAARRNIGAAGATAEAWSLGGNGSTLEFVVVIGSTNFTASAASQLVNGTTLHVVGTHDGTTGLLYVNGSQVGTIAASGNVNAGTRNMAIGTNPASTSSNRWLGKLDEFAFYGSALSSGRVSAHYAAFLSAGSTGTGDITLGGSAVGGAPATSSGSVLLSGAGVAASAGGASGFLVLSGAATEQATVSATGSLVFSAAAASVGAVTAAGSLSLVGSAAAVGAVTATGGLTLTGSGTASVAPPEPDLYPAPSIACCEPAMTRRRVA